MKSFKLISILALLPALLTACGEDSKTNSGCTYDPDCGGNGMICVSGQCVMPAVPEPECSTTKPCTLPNTVCSIAGQCVSLPAEPECSATKPCTVPNTICDVGRCVPQPAPADPECSATKPCTAPNTECSASGKCVPKTPLTPAAGCSNNLGCPANTPICSAGSCKAITDISCGSENDCGLGYTCNNKVCTPKATCDRSKQIGCNNEAICHNGVCMDNTVNTCSKDVKCAAGLTCIAGECVTCNCQADEVCGLNGSCVKANRSETQNINAGEPCVYEDNKVSICDNNRLISCNQGAGESTYTFKIKDCGSNVCAVGLDGLIQCNEPCSNENDTFGQCGSDYNSMSDKYQDTAFMNVCSKTPEGKLFWSYEEKNPFCGWTCTNGYCDEYPSEYGQTCFDNSKDKCSGDWRIYCLTSDKPTESGMIIVENCPKMYEEGAFCTLNAKNKPECATACTQPGETKKRCISNSTESYLLDLKCESGADGKLAFFETDFKVCATKCDADKGICE